jgi:hypothetical protein
VVVRVVTSAGRHVGRWLRAVRHTTVLAGVALGLVLVMALTIAGAVGIDPVPGFTPAGRPPGPTSALSATQPEMRRSLLDSGDLPPGYTATPTTARLGGQARTPRADVPPGTATPSPTGPALLPDLGLADLPLDEEALGGTPAGRDETGHDRGGGPDALPGHPAGEIGDVSGDLADGLDEGDDEGHDWSGEAGHGGFGRDEVADDEDTGDATSGDPVDGHTGGETDGNTDGDTAGTGEEVDRGDVDANIRRGVDGGDEDWSERTRPEAGGSGALSAQDVGTANPTGESGESDDSGESGESGDTDGADGGGGADASDGARGASAAGGASLNSAARLARCRLLLTAPWRLAAPGRGHVAAPEVADHVHRKRGTHLRQALVGFTDNASSAAALATLRRDAAGCDRFRTRVGEVSPAGKLTATGRGDAGPGHGRLATVVLRPAPQVHGPEAESADGLALRIAVTAGKGRAWTGYLIVDRTGPVLSVLWLLGPRGAVTADEASATRRAAAVKARPLAR